MITFKRFEGGLYLTEAGSADPASARVGFLFQDAGRTDPTFVLSAATYPNCQGYFAFFVPSSTRDWASFASAVRTQFTNVAQAQFGWFADLPDNQIGPLTLILVANPESNPSVVSPFSLTFRNVALSVQATPFNPVLIGFDDAANAFNILNAGSNTLLLTVTPPGQGQKTFTSVSQNLIVPVDDTTLQASCVNAAFQLTQNELGSFEAGFMYFGQPVQGQLPALNYPAFYASAGAASPMNLNAWLDVLQPLVDTQTYFQFTDSTLGGFFTTSNGKILSFTTVSAQPATQISRLVFANRPIITPADATTYYLTPAGSFGLSLSGANAATLLCGVTGTEFLNVNLGSASDTLFFQPGQAAYQLTTPGQGYAPPALLSTENGNVTTSWVQLVTATGSYVSQPQDSPLYEQTTSAALSDGGASFYLLEFNALPSWTAEPADAVDVTAPVSTPLAPMVPFAGLTFNTADEAQPFLAMEAQAINPTRKNNFAASASASLARARKAKMVLPAGVAGGELTYSMTPQGLLAGIDANGIWQTTQLAISDGLKSGDPQDILQITNMGDQVREALQQNQIFLVVSTLTNPTAPPPSQLFTFAGPDQTINIAGWPFSISPDGTKASDGTPPIVIFKFWPGHSIKELVDNTDLWSQAAIFNNEFGVAATQSYIQGVIQYACEQVYPDGCPDGTPTGKADTGSIYYNFYQVVTNKDFAGLLALNANMQLDSLPIAIKALTGGMTIPNADPPPDRKSNIAAFRVHHVGVSINDTDPNATTPTLAQSSLFGLVDYEKPKTTALTHADASGGFSVDYNYEVEFLRALFTNSTLSSFSCQVNLTVNNLFGTAVTEQPSGDGAREDGDGGDNVIRITGSYQAHSTSGDDTTSGEGVYSFVAEGNFDFNFAENPYLENITLTKLQFSFDQETESATDPNTSTIEASFGIWGSLVFNEFQVLDIFAFEQLVFNDLGIAVQFDLSLPPGGQPSTTLPVLTFNPGNLRLDLATSTPKEGSTSLLSLLPFKLTSFLYNEYPDQQTVQDLQYYSLSSVPLDPGFKLVNQFNYALLFDLDLGTLGALVGSLEAFKFSFLIGWLTDDDTGGIAFGVQLPQADGKLEINIEGVLKLTIEEFILRYASDDAMLVVALHNWSLTVLGQRLPPTGQFDLALFAPTSDSARIGWIAAYNNMSGGGTQQQLQAGRMALTDGTNGRDADGSGDGDGDGDSKPVFNLKYLGLGQRTGPDPTSPPTNFADFMTFMTTTFWDAVQNEKYDEVYHPDGQWLAITDFQLLGIIEVGFVFYDVTPFYSLTLNVEKLFNFEITYTKISDSIGLFYANFSLPDSLRTFQVGAASLTLPSIGVSVYTNGDWKLDVGFPNGDDWSRCFRVQAQAGPVPVTGSGGFYLARLSSATSNIFPGGNYPLIVAFGFAARLGVGKDFTSGPLKAGVSVTFFGIIEGAAGYLSSGLSDIFQAPDALSLKGQFGIIGELYGSVDFVIIKASVNVRLQASIGIVMSYQRSIPDSGSILLYIEASVSVSVKVEIDFGFFSISISFSFRASFRFEWQLASPGTTPPLLIEMRALRDRRLSRLTAATTGTMPILPLIDGFTAALGLWYLPEGTVVFPAATGTGTPWVASSLGVQYNPSPSGTPPYSAFYDFEKVTAQLVTWALGVAFGLEGATYTVTLDQMNAIDQTPDVLVGSIDYGTLLQQLAVFSGAAVTVPTAPASATTFPMPPFFQLQTTGRLNSANQADDLTYVFSSKNVVPATYITEVDAYFNQLFVNQTSNDAAALTATLAAPEANVPLIQEIFLNYFTGLIRGAVHQLLQTMQNNTLDSSPIDTLISTAVGAGEFGTLAGQMSSSFRGGARLPYTAGLTVPGGDALTTTNPLYALLWQEFPVGTLGTSNQYTIQLTNADTTQTWIVANVNWPLTSSWLTPFAQANASDVVAPSAPQQLPFTDVGPQAFAFENPIVWTQPDNVTVNLYPFPANLTKLQSTTGGDIAVVVESRQGGAPYLPCGTPLATSSFVWATQIELTVAQVPAGDGTPLPDVYSLSGASQSDQQLLEDLLNAIGTTNPIAGIQVLYQTSAGSSGLSSDTIDRTQVFVLRTNTTTVSVPPPAALMLAMAEETTVPVGAEIDDDADFLQIIQQASVTNAPGYYLRYINSSKKSLPTDLFSSGPAPLTILITYTADGSQNTPASPTQVCSYYNSIILTQTTAGTIYYAETTDPAMDTQYNSVAAGSVGVVLSRDDSTMLMRPSPELCKACGANGDRLYRRSELVQLLVAAGITDENEVRQLIADSGGTAAQLNALYSLITYQVQQTSGFIASNLSAPIQPTQPDEDCAAADGVVLADDDDTRLYRVYVPLYNLAVANQPLSDTPPNRYASIPDPISIAFYQNDTFGNQMPSQQTFDSATNYYFDPITGIDEWQGVVTAYDFLAGTTAQPDTVTVYLQPSSAAFTGSTVDTAALLTAYYTIYDQLTGPGVTLYLETNLALDASNNMVKVALTAAQTKGITDMVSAIIAYLENPAQPFSVTGTSVSVAVTNSGTLPPAFELAVLLGIERSITLISPLLVDNGVCTFPSAQNRYTAIVPTVGSSTQNATASVDITTFASYFVTAFSGLTLAVGLGGATESTQNTSTAARTRRALEATGVPADSTGSGSSSSSQSLWAVQSSMLAISVGTAASHPGPFYQSPMPLDNTLNTQVVPLPALPAGIQPSNWPASQLFTDVDLDRLNSAFFSAVDNFLAPASAAYAFEHARTAYTAVAEGRASLADEYSTHEIDWLFGAGAPFTGTAPQLDEGQTAFGQQMRAALATAYTTDTIVQYTVSWSSQLPAGIGDLYQLYGMIQPSGNAALPGGYTFSASWVDIPVSNADVSTLTFLFGVADVEESAKVIPIDLEYNVTHVQHFLQPASATPEGEARPSIWLQLVDPYPQGVPHLGPANTQTQIPVVFRQYPTPPTVIDQTATAGGSSNGTTAPSTNPLTAAAAWHLIYSYQAQLTQHDQLATEVTYNTDLSASSGGGTDSLSALADPVWTLFEALARFSAAYPVLSPFLTDLSAANQGNWILAAQAFADLVSDVVNNSTWNPALSESFTSSLPNVTDVYTVVDVPDTGTFREITLSWDAQQGESSFDGVTLAVEAISPVTNQPYPNQTAGTTTNGITDQYTPDPPLVDFWVIHQVEVDGLNVLIAENALAGVQVQRNVIEIPSGNTTYTAQQEFIYTTPFVRATQPITPFIDSAAPIDIATLPNQSGSSCPSAPPPGVNSLCQRIYTMMYDLLADEPALDSLVRARTSAGLDESAARRVKVSCSYQYQVATFSSVTSANPVAPLFPVVLARSFVIDATQSAQLNTFSSQFATAAATWAANNAVAFGTAAQTNAQFVFDITLYAQISGVNTPVLRLRNLQLKLSDITV